MAAAAGALEGSAKAAATVKAAKLLRTFLFDITLSFPARLAGAAPAPAPAAQH